MRHRDIGNVGGPRLIGPLYRQISEQIRVDRMPGIPLSGLRLLVDYHKAHEPHETSDPLVVHIETFSFFKCAVIRRIP